MKLIDSAYACFENVNHKTKTMGYVISYQLRHEDKLVNERYLYT